jgi:hypothetical protein
MTVLRRFMNAHPTAMIAIASTIVNLGFASIRMYDAPPSVDEIAYWLSLVVGCGAATMACREGAAGVLTGVLCFPVLAFSIFARFMM